VERKDEKGGIAEKRPDPDPERLKGKTEKAKTPAKER